MARNRKRKKPPLDEKLIYQMASMGVGLLDIARYFGVTPEYLKRKYGYEIEAGRITANVTIANKLYETALDGHVSAMIFWLKARAGWRETAGAEVSEVGEENATRVREMLERFINYYQQSKNNTQEGKADDDDGSGATDITVQ